MQTRSSVLGKRHAPSESSLSTLSSPASSSCDLAPLPTPEHSPSAKRVKYSGSVVGGDGNKENIPPYRVDAINSPTTTRVTRLLHRASTEHLSPSRTRSTPRRHASASGILPATPATAISYLSLTTPPPTPHSSIQPISSRVRALLRPTCNQVGHMAGRLHERDVITRFISGLTSLSPEGDSTEKQDASILYISGSPGTGKTALVNAVLAEMKEQLDVAQVSVVTVNCMALNDVDALYEKLVEDLSKGSMLGRRSAGKGRKLKESSLEIIGRLLDEQSTKCLVLLDEVDHIASSSQALTSLFALARAHESSLRLIGIANTHTLSASSSATSVSMDALAGVETMHFAPYTPAQLMEIVQARLAPLKDDASDVTSSDSLAKFLPTPTLMLLTKKIAAMTGDVRAVFEVLRGAISIAINTPAANAVNPLEMATNPVTPSHVLAALKAYNPASNTSRAAASSTPKKTSDSEVVIKVRELGLQARLVLLSMVLARRRLDAGLPLSGSSTPSPSSVPRTPSKRSHSMSDCASSSGIDVSQLHNYYKTILGRSDDAVFNLVSRSEFSDLLGLLETVGLLALSGAASLPSTPSKSGKRNLARSVSFGGARSGGMANTQEVKFVEGVRMDEVCRGLAIGDSPAVAAAAPAENDLMQEEIRAVFEKERVRILRESKAKTPSSAVVDTFEDSTAP